MSAITYDKNANDFAGGSEVGSINTDDWSREQQTMTALFALILLVLHSAAPQQQECSDPAASPTTTPCITGLCPTGRLCIQSPRGEFCCDSTKVIPVTPTVPCQDFVDPRTGISDCPEKKHLCENLMYRQLMKEQCPLTCNICQPACQDLVDPRTGVSDCVRNRALCNNLLYQQLMKKQCPKTCGYCI
ncbi:unnamed protein product [Cylicocyclus nassatus]|uniref:ShKT domain-containing protein n=1 Tax=Cylicocyclus nassatus TaxID=53992 RepID=A0AA36DM12_CYLNA|nr:unnamed protein product [Cylicocyclus nassatus]